MKGFFAKIIIAAGVLLLLKDCFGLFYLRMTHLSPSQVKWSSCAVVYPEAGFVSDSAGRSTLMIIERTIHNDRNRLFFSWSGGTDYEAYTGYNYNVCQGRLRMDGSFMLRKSVKTDSLVFSAGLNGFYTRRDEPFKPRRIAFGTRVVDSCLVVDSTNAQYNHTPSNPQAEIDKFIVSKEYGLVYYRFKTGEQFFRRFE